MNLQCYRKRNCMWIGRNLIIILTKPFSYFFAGVHTYKHWQISVFIDSITYQKGSKNDESSHKLYLAMFFLVFFQAYTPTSFDKHHTDLLVDNQRMSFVIWDTSGRFLILFYAGHISLILFEVALLLTFYVCTCIFTRFFKNKEKKAQLKWRLEQLKNFGLV